MPRKKSNISAKRTFSRGVGARGTTHLPDGGREAHKVSKQGVKGIYRIEFTQTYMGVSEKDVDLRLVYGKDLVAGNVGVPSDMITLRAKKDSSNQTLTALDEVFYVRVGKDNYGKLSIRTQRMRRSIMLIFIFQVKKNAIKPPQKSFSRTNSFNKTSTSQRSQGKRNSYRNRDKRTT